MSKVRRRIAVELPPEAQTPGADNVGLLQRAMYGTRDAAMCWEQEVADMIVNELKGVQSRATPCNFYLKTSERELRITVHGDDLETLGYIEDLL